MYFHRADLEISGFYNKMNNWRGNGLMSMDTWRIIFLRATTSTNLIIDALPTVWQSFVHFYRADLEILTMTGGGKKYI